MKSLWLFILIVFMAGCSSKVQTNPLPDNKKFYLPDAPIKRQPKDETRYKEEFERYARKVLNVSDLPMTQEENNDIFSIGYKKEKFTK